MVSFSVFLEEIRKTEIKDTLIEFYISSDNDYKIFCDYFNNYIKSIENSIKLINILYSNNSRGQEFITKSIRNLEDNLKFIEDIFKENKVKRVLIDIYKLVPEVVLNKGQEHRIKGFVLKSILPDKIEANNIDILHKSCDNLDLNSLKKAVNLSASNEDVLYEMQFNGSIYKFKGNGFLNKLGISFNDFKELILDNNLTSEELFYTIANLNLIVFNPKTKGISTPIIKHNKNSDALTENFSEENYFEQDVIETISGNYADDKIRTEFIYDNIKIESSFTDFQAFHICKGIKNKRSLYDNYTKNNYTEKDRAEAHINAINLLKKHGKPFISFLLSLPELPFKCDRFKLLFSTLDKRKDTNENAIIRLKVNSPIPNDAEHNIEFSFFVEDNTKYINQIRVRNKTKRINLFDISRDGMILPKANQSTFGINLSITPVLELFYQITKSEDDLKNAIISYGIETGFCSVCGRELTDKISKLKGVGPICEQYI